MQTCNTCDGELPDEHECSECADYIEAWQTLVRFHELLGAPIQAVHTDNGSEFLGAFHEGCEREKIKHYFSKPRTPKNHAHIERFNGTLQIVF